MSKHLLLAGIVALLSGCGTVYSPSLHLGDKPLSKNDGQVTLGYGVLNNVDGPGSIYNDGNDLQIRYAYSDRFSISVKGWSSSSLVLDGKYNGGFLANGILTFNDRDERLIVGLIPTWNLLFDNNDVRASGASIQGAVWLPPIDQFRFYVATGPGFIANNFENNWGYGLITNAGVNYTIDDNFQVSGELNSMLAHNVSNNDNYVSLGAMMGVSWFFHNQ